MSAISRKASENKCQRRLQQRKTVARVNTEAGALTQQNVFGEVA
jgi:hypothetical protein